MKSSNHLRFVAVIVLCAFMPYRASGAIATISIDSTTAVSTNYEYRELPVILVVNNKEQYCGLDLDATECNFEFPDGVLILELVVKLRGSEASVFDGSDLAFEGLKFTLTPIDVESPLNIRIAPVHSKWNNRKLVEMAAESWINEADVDERRLHTRFQEARAAWMAQRARLNSVPGARADDYTVKGAFLLVQAASKLVRAIPSFRADADAGVRQASEFLTDCSPTLLKKALGASNDVNAKEAIRIVNVSRATPLARAWNFAREAPANQRYRLFRQFEVLFMKSVPENSIGKELVAETKITLPVILQSEAAALADDLRCGRITREDFVREGTTLVSTIGRRIYRETKHEDFVSVEAVCDEAEVKSKTQLARLCARHAELNDFLVAKTVEARCNRPG